MAKQKKDVPPIYQGLEKNPATMRQCIAIDQEGNISVFQNKAQLERLESYESLIKPSLQACFDNFDKFLDLNEQTILTYHDQMFGSVPPKGQDRVTTASLTWYKLVANAKNNLVPKVPTDPVTGKASKVSASKYMKGEVTEGTADVRTFQALQSLKLFRDCIGDREEVTEAELKQYVEDHAGELKTRQPAWRIFQYYRPTLMRAKLLRRV